MNNQTKTIELIDGHTDKKGVTHKNVTFGKRLTVERLIDIEYSVAASSALQYGDKMLASMIIAFGTLMMPVSPLVLLSLNKFDREDLREAAEEFLSETRGDAEGEILSESRVKLPFGFEIDDVRFDVVEFGNVLSGKDYLDAEKYPEGTARNCFEMGREIVKIEAFDGSVSIGGQVSVEQFKTLDAADYGVLLASAENWRSSFRRKRKEVSGKRNGENGVDSEAGNRNDGKRDS
ncbi:MAG: hypothetical protein M3209_00200 [Acidobacteriota bacterium]|nr:hypothetical protein [Acidobacteriota bacterium]